MHFTSQSASSCYFNSFDEGLSMSPSQLGQSLAEISSVGNMNFLLNLDKPSRELEKYHFNHFQIGLDLTQINF